MTDDNSDSGAEKRTQSDVRYFNPMVTWIYLIAVLAIIYSIGYIIGMLYMIAATLFLLVWLFREVIYLLRVLENRFGRIATYFNIIHSTAWFVFFVINAYYYELHGVYLLFPEFTGLTMLAPLFVATAMFGLINIRKMYLPE